MSFLVKSKTHVAFCLGVVHNPGTSLLFDRPEDMITKRGIFIPFTTTAYQSLGILDGTYPEELQFSPGFSGCMLTPEGGIRTYFAETDFTNKRYVTAVDVPLRASFYGISNTSEATDSIYANLLLHKTLVAAIDKYCEQSLVKRDRVIVMPITGIKALVQRALGELDES